MSIDLVWLILFLPLAGVLINGLAGFQLPKRVVAAIACLVILGAFLVTLGAMLPAVQNAGTDGFRDLTLYQWFAGSTDMGLGERTLAVPFAIRLDPLSLTMALVVTGVGFLIHVYSVGYMWDDPRFARYFTFLNLFSFSMLILVLANNYLLMFVGWEGVGLCSYLLIGFWFDKPSAAFAGKKAFLVNRVGDFGFILGMLAIFATFGTFVYSTPGQGGDGIFNQIVANPNRFHVGAAILTMITLLLFLGATGKSAQWPLYIWLPDAMEGPTPVSALIHAATMVTAGVYMVARSGALYSRAPVAEAAVAAVGIFTALFAAIVAVYQYDIKRVLAWSTISQLGYMFVGVGVGAYATGIFHLVTHAFFKALLFLGAGSVMHGLAGELDMRKMGGLKKWMPITYWTFLIGWLAICGIPPFAGFYSKDAILDAAMQVYPAISWLGVFVAGLTAFYMSRLFLTIFEGKPRLGSDAEAAHGVAPGHDLAHGPSEHASHAAHAPHESPPVMWVPLVVLAALSLLGGIWLNGMPLPVEESALGTFLAPSFKWAIGNVGEAHGAIPGDKLAIIAGLVALAGIGIALIYHWKGVFARGWREQSGGSPSLLARVRASRVAYCIDFGLRWGEASAWWVRAADARFGYDWLVHFIFVTLGTFLSEILAAMVDTLVIDGIVNGFGKTGRWLAQQLRQLQTGFVRNYALVILTGVVFVILSLMWTVQQH